MQTDSEVIEFIPEQRSAYIVRSGSFPFAGAFDVVPVGTGSRVTATFEATPTGMFRFLGPAFIRLATRQFARDLGSLKRRMEAHDL